MSTLAIVLIAIAVIAVIALLAFLLSPKRREQRRLAAERDRAAEHHREEARQRAERAEIADQHAREARLNADHAEQEARMERERAQVHEGRADLHERGLADDELGRDRTPDARADRDADGVADRDEQPGGRFAREDERTSATSDEDVASRRSTR